MEPLFIFILAGVCTCTGVLFGTLTTWQIVRKVGRRKPVDRNVAAMDVALEAMRRMEALAVTVVQLNLGAGVGMAGGNKTGIVEGAGGYAVMGGNDVEEGEEDDWEPTDVDFPLGGRELVGGLGADEGIPGIGFKVNGE